MLTSTEPPDGWQSAFDTWSRIWRGACRELDRNPYSARATLVNRTAYAHLLEMTFARRKALRENA